MLPAMAPQIHALSPFLRTMRVSVAYNTSFASDILHDNDFQPGGRRATVGDPLSSPLVHGDLKFLELHQDLLPCLWMGLLE